MTISLETEVQFVKGVGPQRAEQLAALTIRTAGDLLNHFPRSHQQRGELVPLAEVRPGQTVSVLINVVRTSFRPRRIPIFRVEAEQSGARCEVIWFHGGFLRDRISLGDLLVVYGKVKNSDGVLQWTNPDFNVIKDPEADLDSYSNRIVPVYPATTDLSSGRIAAMINRFLPQALSLVAEFLPQKLRDRNELPLRSCAYSQLHAPKSMEEAHASRRRFAYEELLLLQLAMGLRRQHHAIARQAHPLAHESRIDGRIRARLPFKLTEAQDRAITEISADLQRSQPMNRLLQGDVGSGKTVVALYACLMAVANKTQSAIMAPTEILAEQHFHNIKGYLANSRVRIALLVGGLSSRQRKELLDSVTRGEVDLVIGTQALLEENVVFDKLGLVIVDEQHKFGVRQRAVIRSKGLDPHYLVMTATPIPRTLSLTLFGDLDVSVIDSLPPGRGQIKTRLFRPKQREKAFKIALDHLKAGQQVYVVYPLVHESMTVDLRAAEQEAVNLSENEFSGYRVGLVHGQLDQLRKDEIMDRFRQREIDVLVATIVVEVGVDVASATVMMIEHAERFGLAQLHQLRGRIGRGSADSVCILLGNPTTDAARQRLKILTQTNDGFRIAEEDLRIRGPGEFFGTRQHGMPELRVADLIADYELLLLARRDATKLLADDPSLRKPDHMPLREQLRSKYADSFTLIDGA